LALTVNEGNELQRNSKNAIANIEADKKTESVMIESGKKSGLHLIGFVLLVLLSCNTKSQKVEIENTKSLYFTVDSILHHKATSAAYYVHGKIHNNTDDSMCYSECDRIIGCSCYRMRRLGAWSTIISCFGDPDTLVVLPHSYRNTLCFFYDWEDSAICSADSIVVNLSYFYKSSRDSLREENISFGINHEQIKIGELPRTP
jgi:hypothetical protein